jgi:tripartite-type tricarboxylate transporter receptor subunit TctC
MRARWFGTVLALGWAVTGLGLLTGATVTPALAKYPEQVIKVVVGFPPGGGGDLYARIIATALQKVLKNTVIVDNRPGAGGEIAAAVVARSRPDGYTLLLGMSGNIAVAPPLRGAKLPYKSPDDFVPIAMIAQMPFGLMAAKDSKFKTVQDVLTTAKSGNLSYASTGTGGSAHIGMEMFKQRSGADILHVPYRGSGPAITDLIGGRVDLFFAPYPPVIGQIMGAGPVRLIATTGTARHSDTPEVPTLKEMGVDLVLHQWYGLMVPAGTPPDVIDVLTQAMTKAMADPETIKAIDRDGASPGTLSGKDFDAFIVEDIARYRTAITSAGLQTE